MIPGNYQEGNQLGKNIGFYGQNSKLQAITAYIYKFINKFIFKVQILEQTQLFIATIH